MAFLKSSSSLVVALAAAMAILAAIATTTSAQNTPQDYVDQHNLARAADGVGPVAWDATLAQYAEDYAAERAGDCELVHSGGPYGENIFWGSAGWPWSAADAVTSWVDEKKNYHLDTNSCDAGEVCGHYTQVVWRKSFRIGCARVDCVADLGALIVCSYDPPGNFNGESPFVALDAAAK